MEELLPQKERFLINYFPSVTSFRLYIDKYRAWKFDSEGWIRALIKLPRSGCNSTGIFWPAMKVLTDIFSKHQYIGDMVLKHRITLRPDGLRGYTCCVDCAALEEYQYEVGNRGDIILIDIHCDGFDTTGQWHSIHFPSSNKISEH